ncbi:MAG: hypothetical protein ABJF50_07210 [Paracoccaceae bacterium]
MKILWLLPKLTFLTALLLSCEQVPSASVKESGPKIFQTNIAIEDLIFLPGQQRVARVSGPRFDLCRDGSMAPNYKVATIMAWTGRIFRSAVNAHKGCRFSVSAIDRLRPTPGDIQTDDCVAQVKMREQAIYSIHIFTKSKSPAGYFQCEFRLSMAYLGYLGALSMSEADMFEEQQSPEAFYRIPYFQSLSHLMPEPFVKLQWSCRGYASPYLIPPGLTRAEAINFYRKSDCLTE